jgi:hypothetical protein
MKKDKIIQTINQKGITNIKNYSTSIPSEKYIICIYNILKVYNSYRVDIFLEEFKKIIKHKNFPLFHIDLVKLLYRSWISNPKICDELISFANNIRFKMDSQDTWEAIILKSYRLANKKNEIAYRFSLLAILFKEKTITKKNAQNMIPIIKSVLELNLTIEDLTNSKSKLLIKYKLMFHWAKLISERCRDDYRKINLCTVKMIDKHFHQKGYSTFNDESYFKFINIISRILSMDFLNWYSLNRLNSLYESYLIDPEIFNLDHTDENRYQTTNIHEYFFKKWSISNLLSKFNKFNSEEEWFYHILKGEKLTDLKNTPLKLTRKAAHEFRNIEPGLGISIKQGFVYASLLSLKVEPEYAMQVTIAIKNFKESQFWVTIMTRFFENGLTVEKSGDVMDYVYHQQFTERKTINWKHKNTKNLLNDVEAWHNEITSFRRHTGFINSTFRESNIPNMEIEIEDKKYSIRQIRSSKELHEEGIQLNHCVISYNNYCKLNQCEIFSLQRINTLGETTPLITIEIRGNHIQQAKGKHNRSPYKSEIEIIKAWATESNLLISEHIQHQAA